jgi:hypothetical protein
MGVVATASRAAARDEMSLMTSVAESVLRRSGGVEALETLAWAPSTLATEEDRRITAALFRAMGRTCAVTPALGRLVVVVINDAPAGSAIAATPTHAGDLGALGGRSFVVGPTGLLSATAVVVLDGDEILVGPKVTPAGVDARPMDDGAVEQGWVDRSRLRPLASGAAAARQLGSIWRAGRFAIAHEILGACDGAMKIAVEYSRDRMQFGSPIGRFQAVQHILAEAELHRRALETACVVAARTGIDGAATAGATVASEGIDGAFLKALAGRSGRVVMQSTLQVLGAIGFTEEHIHHRFFRRALAMDALFGSSAALTRAIGSAAIASKQVWQYPVIAPCPQRHDCPRDAPEEVHG